MRNLLVFLVYNSFGTCLYCKHDILNYTGYVAKRYSGNYGDVVNVDYLSTGFVNLYVVDDVNKKLFDEGYAIVYAKNLSNMVAMKSLRYSRILDYNMTGMHIMYYCNDSGGCNVTHHESVGHDIMILLWVLVGAIAFMLILSIVIIKRCK